MKISFDLDETLFVNPAAYRIDLHVDDEKSVYENGIANGFRVYRISNGDTGWADNIRKELDRIKKVNQKSQGL